MDHEVFKSMPQYEPKKLLAMTNLSITVLCEHKTSKQKHVIKICNTEKVLDHTKDLIMQEAALLKKLNHPNIIKYVDSFVLDKTVIIITEYANLGDLQQQIKYAKTNLGTPNERQFLNLTMITSIIGQICRGLQYIHSQNIVHRDIKPANIFLIRDANSQKITAKIADFGVSRYVGSNEQAKTVIGSLSYIAPEIVVQMPYNWTCDLWSLGILIYEMLELEIPFAENKINVYKTQELPQLQYKFASNQDLKDAVQMLLKIQPEQRISETKVLELPFIKKVLAKVDQMK